MHRRGRENLHSLKAVSNNAGLAGRGGLAFLTEAGMVDRLTISYLGNNKVLEKQYLNGEISIELNPQGTIAERLRAGGAGIPAFFTPTGARKWAGIIVVLRHECHANVNAKQIRVSKAGMFRLLWIRQGKRFNVPRLARRESSTGKCT